MARVKGGVHAKKSHRAVMDRISGQREQPRPFVSGPAIRVDDPVRSRIEPLKCQEPSAIGRGEHRGRNKADLTRDRVNHPKRLVRSVGDPDAYERGSFTVTGLLVVQRHDRDGSVGRDRHIKDGRNRRPLKTQTFGDDGRIAPHQPVCRPTNDHAKTPVALFSDDLLVREYRTVAVRCDLRKTEVDGGEADRRLEEHVLGKTMSARENQQE